MGVKKNGVRLVLGTMTFGESVFLPDAKDFTKLFFQEGYNELDTAYVYNDGESERILGRVLESSDSEFRIATKVNPRISGRLDADSVFKQVGESLSRLNRSFADIVYFHFPDPATQVEGPLEALNELHDKGRIKEFGLSNYPAWMVADICHICDKNGWVKPTVYEGIYNPLARKAETELIDCLSSFGLRFYAYNPLAGGLLSGRYRSFEIAPDTGRFVNRPNYQNRYWKKGLFDAVDLLREKGEDYGISVPELTYRWLVYHSMLRTKTGDAVIVGASSIGHLKQNLNAVGKGELPDALLPFFDEVWDMCKADSPEYFTMFKSN